MEIASAAARARPAAGSAVPAEQREALRRYVAQLLGSGERAGEVVERALDEIAEAAGNGGPAPGTERLFAVCRRHAFGELRRGGGSGRAVAPTAVEATSGWAKQVESLSPKQREAVWLKFQYGFDYDAIGNIAALPTGQVGELMHAALARLREIRAGETGQILTTDDARVTAWALDEMSEGERRAFEPAVRDDETTAKMISEIRALAIELRAAFAERRSAATDDTNRKAAGGFWRSGKFYAIAGGIAAAAILGVVLARRVSPGKGGAAASPADEIQLKPDAWKISRRAAEDPSHPGSGGAGAGGHARSQKPLASRAGKEADPADNDSGSPAGAGGANGPGAGESPESPRSDAPAGAVDGSPEADGAVAPAEPKGPTGDVAPEGAGPGAPGIADAAKSTPAPASQLAAPLAPFGAPQAPANGGGGKSPSATKPAPAATGKAGAATANAVAATRAKPAAPAPASDPDVTSFRAVRDALAKKQWPSPDAVNPAQLANYFPDNARAADDAPPVDLRVEVADTPWAPGHKLVRIVAQAANRPVARPTVNLVLLVDVSGSMRAPNRLPLVQEAARQLLADLGPQDQVGLVTYAGESHLALPSTPVAKAPVIVAALAGLRAEGETNGSDGLRSAYELARRGFVAGGVNRVILCTDGDFNAGVTDETELGLLVAAEAKRGVTLAVLGFGRGRRVDPRLETLGQRGQGGSAYVNTRREAERALLTQIDGVRQPAARQLQVALACDPARVTGCRLIGAGDQFLPPEQLARATVSLDTLMPGHAAGALYEVTLAEGEGTGAETAPASGAGAGAEKSLGTVRLDYAEPKTGEANHLDAAAVDRATPLANASPDCQWAAAVARFGLILRTRPVSAAQLAEVVKQAEAAANATAAASAGQPAGDADAGGYREEFISMAREAETLAREEAQRPE